MKNQAEIKKEIAALKKALKSPATPAEIKPIFEKKINELSAKITGSAEQTAAINKDYDNMHFEKDTKSANEKYFDLVDKGMVGGKHTFDAETKKVIVDLPDGKKTIYKIDPKSFKMTVEKTPDSRLTKKGKELASKKAKEKKQLDEIIKANPVFKDTSFKSDLEKWNALEAEATKLGLDGTNNKAKFIAKGMEYSEILAATEQTPTKRKAPKGPNVIINKVNMDKEKIRFDSMLHAIQNTVSAGELSSGTNLSKYDDIDKLRALIIAHLKETKTGSDKFTLTKLRELSAKFAPEVDCDDLIAKEKKRRAKKKAAATKREKKSDSSKNIERVEKASEIAEKSVIDRVQSGDKVSLAEVRKLKDEYVAGVKTLEDLLKKIKSGSKKATGGPAGAVDYDCDELIAAARKRKTKAKAAAKKSDAKPEQKKNVERVEKATEITEENIFERIKYSKSDPTNPILNDVTPAEIEKLIAAYKKIIAKLDKLIEKLKDEEYGPLVVTNLKDLVKKTGNHSTIVPKAKTETRTYLGIGFDKLSRYKQSAVSKAHKIMGKLIDLGYVEKHDYGRGKGKYRTVKAADHFTFDELAEFHDANKPFIKTPLEDYQVAARFDGASSREYTILKENLSKTDAKKLADQINDLKIYKNRKVIHAEYSVALPFETGGKIKYNAAAINKPVTNKERLKAQEDLIPQSDHELDKWVRLARFTKQVEIKLKSLGLTGETESVQLSKESPSIIGYVSFVVDKDVYAVNALELFKATSKADLISKSEFEYNQSDEFATGGQTELINRPNPNNETMTTKPYSNDPNDLYGAFSNGGSVDPEMTEKAKEYYEKIYGASKRKMKRGGELTDEDIQEYYERIYGASRPFSSGGKSLSQDEIDEYYERVYGASRKLLRKGGKPLSQEDIDDYYERIYGSSRKFNTGGSVNCEDCSDKGYIYSNDEMGNDEIQKCDSCNVYADDDEAREYESKGSRKWKIDISPNFQESMRIYIMVLMNGTPEGQREAADELMDLAKQLDESPNAKIS